MATNRPGPLQWIWYAYGGKLPDRCADWVLHDVTCRTWALRHFARSLVQLAPFCLLVLLPGPLSIRISAVALGLLVGLFYSGCYIGETAEHRAIKHGHPPGTARETREIARDVRLAGKYGVAHRPWWR